MEALIPRRQLSLPPSLRQCSACHKLSTSSRRAILATSTTGLQNSDRIQRRSVGNIASPGSQAHPLGGFYADLLSQPIHSIRPAPRTSPNTLPVPSSIKPPKSDREEALAKARIVFGSRLSGPAERRDEIIAGSKNVAGVMVPPRPTEPDNCCMSGCVNCVYDRYQEELEEWAMKSAEARVRLAAQNRSNTTTGDTASSPTSTDNDAGGVEANLAAASTEDPFAEIPVGIREFMKMEKALREKRKTSKSAAG